MNKILVIRCRAARGETGMPTTKRFSVALAMAAAVTLGISSGAHATAIFGAVVQGFASDGCSLKYFQDGGSSTNSAHAGGSLSDTCLEGGFGPKLTGTGQMEADASTAGVLDLLVSNAEKDTDPKRKKFSSVGSQATADADTGITLTAPTGFTGTTVQFTEELVVTGSGSGFFGGDGNINVEDSYSFVPFTTTADFGIYNTALPSPNFTVSVSPTASVQNGVAHAVLDFSLFGFAYGGCNGCTSTLNLADTAQVVQILPPGWTFTSDSGDFLSGQPSSPTPEPGSMLLFGTALAGLGILLRRRAGTRRREASAGGW